MTDVSNTARRFEALAFCAAGAALAAATTELAGWVDSLPWLHPVVSVVVVGVGPVVGLLVALWLARGRVTGAGALVAWMAFDWGASWMNVLAGTASDALREPFYSRWAQTIYLWVPSVVGVAGVLIATIVVAVAWLRGGGTRGWRMPLAAALGSAYVVASAVLLWDAWYNTAYWTPDSITEIVAPLTVDVPWGCLAAALAIALIDRALAKRPGADARGS